MGGIRQLGWKMCYEWLQRLSGVSRAAWGWRLVEMPQLVGRVSVGTAEENPELVLNRVPASTGVPI